MPCLGWLEMWALWNYFGVPLPQQLITALCMPPDLPYFQMPTQSQVGEPLLSSSCYVYLFLTIPPKKVSTTQFQQLVFQLLFLRFCFSATMWQAESGLVDLTVGIRVTLWLPLIYCKTDPMPEEDEKKLRTRVLLRKNRFERECLEDPAFPFPQVQTRLLSH